MSVEISLKQASQHVTEILKSEEYAMRLFLSSYKFSDPQNWEKVKTYYQNGGFREISLEFLEQYRDEIPILIEEGKYSSLYMGTNGLLIHYFLTSDFSEFEKIAFILDERTTNGVLIKLVNAIFGIDAMNYGLGYRFIISEHVTIINAVLAEILENFTDEFNRRNTVLNYEFTDEDKEFIKERVEELTLFYLNASRDGKSIITIIY